MPRKGRPKKSNAKRHPNGRIVHEVQIVKGSEWVQAQQAKYQTHYSTALGRAYAGGLLAQTEELALDRYQGGKRFARIYNRVCGGETYRCPLDRTPRGSEGEIEACENDARDREWLFAVMDSLDDAGLRPWLDQLITRVNTDYGPTWLDRLLDGSKDPCDLRVLDAAVKALDVVAPARKAIGIVSMRWDDAA